MKEAHTVDTKFMLEGDNLIHDKGKEFILFLQQAINAMRDEDKEDDLEESKEGEVEGFTDLGQGLHERQATNQQFDEDQLLAQRLQEEMYRESDT